MSDQADNLEKQLKQFGLSGEAVKLYLTLVKASPLTALELSRRLRIARTKVYRLLEKLISLGLVAEEIKGYGKKFVSTSPRRLLEIVHEKERETLLLKATAPTIVNQLHQLQNISNSNSKILHYQGIEGLKQVTWNTTKVEGVFRIYEYGPSMNNFLEKEFAEKIRREYSRNQSAEFKQLTNHEHITSFTEVKEFVSQWRPRYIDRKILDIQIEIAIYNDVFVTYEYSSEDVFIVEIYNKQLAEVQKQIFDSIWKIAKPMKKLDEKGAAGIG
ncbi:MAG: hypothetical protein Kow0081_0720 [Candidatus Dojkabacteria bacterium]